jgi:4-hydroxythreonine-4-phosphate dehydrogenase
MMTEAKPLLAITMGDPAGVGPELCINLLNQTSILSECTPIIFGDYECLKRVSAELNQPFDAKVISTKRSFDRDLFSGHHGFVLDFSNINHEAFIPGEVSAMTGKVSFQYFDQAIDFALKGLVDGIVTTPINKFALNLAGISYPGHTEILQTKTEVPSVTMLLTSKTISCSLVTTHIPLSQVSESLNSERIYEVIGLNPHSGESGLFGDEETRIIQPAIERARSNGMDVIGPLAPDTAFIKQNLERFDAFICMYHDQGLIPLKLLSFDSAVNVTLGLPIIRTSVDHGTALDISWKGLVDSSSLLEAVSLASALCVGRH